MFIFGMIYLFLKYVVITVVLALIALMLLRLVVNYADLNPFGWFPMRVKRLSDPFVSPVRQGLARVGLEPKFAPLVVVLIAIVVGYFTLEFTSSVLSTIVGVIISVQRRAPIMLIGSLLVGCLSIYILLIFMRIVFSWGLSSINPFLLFLIRVTEPVLAPFRRLIPPVGMFDISPIIVLFLLQLIQTMVARVMLE